MDTVRGFRLAEGLPSIGDIQDMSQNVTDKIQEFRLLPGLPSIKEISQMSDNANKKRRKFIKSIPQGLNDMGHKITRGNIAEKLR